jgi:hypothetical protein
MRTNPIPPATPTEEQALSFLTELLRTRQRVGRNQYEVYLEVVAERYVLTHTTPEPGIGVDPGPVMGPFYSAAWALCRLGVLRPGPTPGHSLQSSYSHSEAQGYGITEFGRRWIAATPPTLPPLVNPMTDMLLNAGQNFGDAYKLRTRDAALAYNGQAYFACCAMAGAAAEAILLQSAIAKLGEEEAERLYFNRNGRSNLQRSLLGQQTNGFRTQFERHTELISYWRDESAHGHETEIAEGQAYMALNGLLRFAHFASDNWNQLTT